MVFQCQDNQPVLTAALQQNILISYGCREGRCGSCRGRLLSGSVRYPKGEPDALLPGESDAGAILFCSAYPTSDLSIELPKRPF